MVSRGPLTLEIIKAIVHSLKNMFVLGVINYLSFGFCLQPQMLPHVSDIPRSSFHFDFDFERKILAEAERENPNWGKLAMENQPLRTAEPIRPPVC